MSIILDALKKAEKERSPETKETPPPFQSLVVKKRSPLNLGRNGRIALITAALLVAVGFLAYMRLFRKPFFSPSPQPVAVAPHLITPSKPTEDPNSPEGIEKEAFNAFQAGNLESSQALWEKLTLLKPTDPQVYNNLGVVFKKEGKKDEAREAYKKALSLNPDYPEALNNLGVIFMEEQSIDEAKELFNKASTQNPSYPEPYFHLALIAESLGDYQQAIGNYELFIKFSPNLDPQLKAQIETRVISLRGY